MDLPWAMDHTSEGVHSSSRAASSSMTLLIRNRKIINCECLCRCCPAWMSGSRRKIIEWSPTSYKRSQTGHIFNLKGVCVHYESTDNTLSFIAFVYINADATMERNMFSAIGCQKNLWSGKLWRNYTTIFFVLWTPKVCNIIATQW